MPLSRDQILKTNTLVTEVVHVPEWADPETGDDTVIVKGLSGEERDSYEAACMQQRPAHDANGKPIRGRSEMTPNLANVRAKLVVRSVVDEQGERLWTDHQVAEVGQLNAAALDRVFEVAARLSRLSDEDVEELGKGSVAAQPDDSTSGSLSD